MDAASKWNVLAEHRVKETSDFAHAQALEQARIEKYIKSNTT
jgi:hypothetical protein